MSDVNEKSNLMRIVQLATSLFAILFATRTALKWIKADSVDVWLVWLRGGWAAELCVAASAAIIVAVPTVYGLRNNRYIDRD